MGIEVREIPLTKHDVYIADECFLTGTAAEVVPVVTVDSRTIGDGVPGPITRELMARFHELTRKLSGAAVTAANTRHTSVQDAVRSRSTRIPHGLVWIARTFSPTSSIWTSYLGERHPALRHLDVPDPVVIIFCETGLVVTPVLAGRFAAVRGRSGRRHGHRSIRSWLFVLLSLAAIAGDTVNYWIGAFIGPRAFSGEIRFLKKEYLDRTHAFYEKYGGKTIIIARFVPIVRTFAPFVAGIGAMNYASSSSTTSWAESPGWRCSSSAAIGSAIGSSSRKTSRWSSWRSSSFR